MMNVKGAEIDIRSIVVGDNTLSVLEIWGAEYQEQVGDDFFEMASFSREN
jgi:phosphoribosylformylglycinamidine (FGAM) synthase-like enzyme